MNVFDALSRHVNWASQRHSVAAANVANLDTPGFRAKEVAPFALEINATAMRIMRSHERHMGAQGVTGEKHLEVFEQHTIDETHSSNNVSAENEMRVIGDATRAVSSSTALFKLFHRMSIAAAKG
jgi:flagellar basal-body rod protein FlgB